MKRKVYYGVGIILILAAIAVPSGIAFSLAKNNSEPALDPEAQAIVEAFAKHYNDVAVRITSVIRPEQIYLVEWEGTDGMIYLSLFGDVMPSDAEADGVWVELARVPQEVVEQQEDVEASITE